MGTRSIPSQGALFQRNIWALLLTVTLCACSALPPDDGVPENSRAPRRVDFSGNWEKDFQLSDDFNTKFNLFLFDLQRGIPAGAQGESVAARGYGASRDSILGLARFAEEITRMPILEIEQDENAVSITREGTFALRCQHYQQQFVRARNAFGSEVCGWNGAQLVFQMNLADGLTIFHQVTLGPDRQQLNVTTTVSSGQVGSPITISNYYRRYTVPPENFDCLLTLTRNNVCTRNGN